MAPMAIASAISAGLIIVIVGVVSRLGKFVWKVSRSIIWRIYYRTPRLILHGKGPRNTRFSVAKVDSRRSYVQTVTRCLQRWVARRRIWPLSGVMDRKLRGRIWPLSGIMGFRVV